MKSLWNGWPMKTFVSALAFLFGGDRLVHALYVPCGVLLLLDLATGLWAARKSVAHRPHAHGAQGVVHDRWGCR